MIFSKKCTTIFGRLTLALVTLQLTLSPIPVISENILFFLPIATKSHRNVFDPLINALAGKGHQVTVVSPIPPSTSTTKPHHHEENITEIVPLAYTEIFEEFRDPFEERRKGGSVVSSSSFDFVFLASEKIYQSKELMKLQNEKFDLVFFNGMLNNALSCFVVKLEAPVITITTMAAPSFVTEHIGLPLPPSFVPSSFLPFMDRMSFRERFLNTGLSLYFALFGRFLFRNKINDINRRNMGDDCPSCEELDKNVSMIFSNSFHALNFPRPIQPDVVEVGGMHCGRAKPLPKELDEFLSGGDHGFIYFSMGSVVKTDQMPEDIRQKFLNVFSRMKQRVIWKWNSGQMEGLPENVRVSKWLPQQDILGHPKIRVFMTHGGLLSTQEAAYHGVPLIGIPMFADQDLNTKQAENSGYALTLEVLDFTEEKLEGILNQIIYDPQYMTKAKHLSSVCKDQMQTPLERAVYWAEYVLKHKGAAHLRSASRDLDFVQYHSLDVIAFLASIFLGVVLILILSCKVCFKAICGRKKVHKLVGKTKTKTKTKGAGKKRS